MQLPNLSRIGPGLVVGLVVGGALGWLITNVQVQQLQEHNHSTQQSIQSLEATVASQSAVLIDLKDQVAGYEDYVVTHTEQSIEAKYLTGYQLPITGVQPPYNNPAAMPAAARTYRGGVHEGMDFAVAQGTPILAVGKGKIIRVDSDYVEPSKATLDSLSALTESLQFTPEDILDTFRGRQVWLLLPGNVIVRYCHLSAVDVALGQSVEPGQKLGSTGSSGTLDGARHLHFEIRVGNTYLGAGKANAQRIELVRTFFSQ